MGWFQCTKVVLLLFLFFFFLQSWRIRSLGSTTSEQGSQVVLHCEDIRARKEHLELPYLEENLGAALASRPASQELMK